MITVQIHIFLHASTSSQHILIMCSENIMIFSHQSFICMWWSQHIDENHCTYATWRPVLPQPTESNCRINTTFTVNTHSHCNISPMCLQHNTHELAVKNTYASSRISKITNIRFKHRQRRIGLVGDVWKSNWPISAPFHVVLVSWEISPPH